MSTQLKDLIRTGRLPIGTKLHHKAHRYPERSVEAVVLAGGIKVGTKVYDTPSAAARSITGNRTDGWLFWRLPTKALLTSLR